MDTILASIRRILNEDEVAPAEAAPERVSPERGNLERVTPAREPPKPPVPRLEEDVLVLGEAMMVPEKIEPVLVPPPPMVLPAVIVAPPPAATAQPQEVVVADRAAIEGLVAARTRAATAQSFDALHEALLREQPAVPASPASPTLLRAGGPTIEDLVRDELRMLLSNWLDVHLPVMVEGMVRTEIEKLTRR